MFGSVSLGRSTTTGGLNSTWGFGVGEESSSTPLSAGASLSGSLPVAEVAFSFFSFFASCRLMEVLIIGLNSLICHSNITLVLIYTFHKEYEIVSYKTVI